MPTRALTLAASLLLCSAVFAAEPAKPDKAAKPAAKDDPVVATVGDYKVKRSEIEEIWARLEPEVREQYQKAGGKEQFLHEFVSKKLLVLEGERLGYLSRPDVQVDMRVARDTILYNVVFRIEVLDKAFGEEALKKFYEENKERWKTPVQVRVRHILVTPRRDPRIANSREDDATTEEEAQSKIAMIKEALAKEPFEKVAREYSEDSTAPKGGDLGFFGEGAMVKEFEQAAMAVAPGKTTDVVKTEFGYHIIQGVEKKPVGYQPLDEVREAIIEQLFQQDQEALYARLRAYTQEVRKRTTVEVVEGSFPE